MSDPARLEARADGYVRWRTWDPVASGERVVYVHQLLVIAEGADPERVFSAGRFHVHHLNGLKWLNTPENLELRDSAEHAREHDHLGVSA